MSEEEIIKQVDFITKWISKIGLLKEREAIQGLLDLYNKEKEKNKELEQQYDKLSKYFIENHISKDKIKEKIEELKNGTYDAKIILQKLLEK